MGALFGEKVTLGQGNGPDVELVVHGDELYARYETPEGFPVVYDDERGLFCYARVSAGRFVSTGVPATERPPSGVRRHARESPAVRQAKVRAKEASRQERNTP